jgi:predicted nucleic acid-binding protein
MKRVLLDTNVVLDVLLAREPWSKDAAAIWRLCEEGELIGMVVATAVTDIYYIARKIKNADVAKQAVRLCINTFEICAVDRTVIETALQHAGNDFEDNVQIACALAGHADVIATRDQSGYTASP